MGTVMIINNKATAKPYTPLRHSHPTTITRMIGADHAQNTRSTPVTHTTMKEVWPVRSTRRMNNAVLSAWTKNHGRFDAVDNPLIEKRTAIRFNEVRAGKSECVCLRA